LYVLWIRCKNDSDWQTGTVDSNDAVDGGG
jgi:hypothetical protein